MAFLATCPSCSRRQRVDILREVELHDAGDVFVRCNDWCNCGSLFVATGFGPWLRGCRITLTKPTDFSERVGYAIGGYYSAINAGKEPRLTDLDLVAFRMAPGDRVDIPLVYGANRIG